MSEGANGAPSGAATIGPGKQVVLAPERDRADGPLDGIGVESMRPSKRKLQGALQRVKV